MNLPCKERNDMNLRYSVDDIRFLDMVLLVKKKLVNKKKEIRLRKM